MTVPSTTGPRSYVVRFVFSVLLVLLSQVAPAFGQAPARVDVVALMVEFQPDTTRFTTGEGTFDGILFDGVEPPSIDPLPHNNAYFEAHLRFLEHYVSRASDRSTRVVTHLLPDVIRVSKPMGSYSPTGLDAGSDAELSKLSALVTEAWTLADRSSMSLPAGLDPATTSFVLFHAGVGRDIELVGTTLDKTPEDLPSIFFDEQALNRLGASGVTMDGFPITNSMVIPRTESRLGVDPLTSEPFLVELSINGLLAASFFNYLGVPDLFNTETGDTAIGPFGLMDALGIFAYSGLFPPEPSAWTKQFLGWSDIIGSGDSGTIELLQTGDRTRNEVARVPISSSEYFLVENRHRDPLNDGVRMTVWTHEGEQEVVFQNGDPEFNDQTISGFPGGVVLAVDDYDFALPGGLDENNNPLLGGILIWHIDENRLREGLPENRVNADRNARAVDLEEADGAQDIGFGSGASFFGPRFDLGTPFDFWFEGNPVTVRTSRGQDIRLYENRFAGDTYPSSYTNRDAPSGVVLSDFSAVGREMTFNVSREPYGVVDSFGTAWLSTLPGVSEAPAVLLSSQELPYFWLWLGDRFGSSVGTALGGCFGETAAIQPIAIGRDLIVLTDSELVLVTAESGSCSVSEILSFPHSSRTWTTPALEWIRFPGELRLYAGFRDERGPALMAVTLHEDGRVDEARIDLNEEAKDLFVSEREAGSLFLMSDSGVLDGLGSLLISADLSDATSSSMAGTASDWTLAWTSESSPTMVHVLDSDDRSRVVEPIGSCNPEHVAWRDLDRDGELAITFVCGASVQAAYESGAVLDGFPLELTAHAKSQPVFSFDESGNELVIVSTADGLLEGFTRTDFEWERLAGFPLSTAISDGTAPLVFEDVILFHGGEALVDIWAINIRLSNSTYVPGQGLFVQRPDVVGPEREGSRLLVGSETYNWPNPIESGSTRIRFEVQEASSVEIDIVDMSGVLIDHIEVASAIAGVPSEVIWQTEAGSGIYMARVKATALSGGRTDTRIIRMAIIR